MHRQLKILPNCAISKSGLFEYFVLCIPICLIRNCAFDILYLEMNFAAFILYYIQFHPI